MRSGWPGWFSDSAFGVAPGEAPAVELLEELSATMGSKTRSEAMVALARSSGNQLEVAFVGSVGSKLSLYNNTSVFVPTMEDKYCSRREKAKRDLATAQ